MARLAAERGTRTVCVYQHDDLQTGDAIEFCRFAGREAAGQVLELSKTQDRMCVPLTPLVLCYTELVRACTHALAPQEEWPASRFRIGGGVSTRGFSTLARLREVTEDYV
jgi:hypothetical protein